MSKFYRSLPEEEGASAREVFYRLLVQDTYSQMWDSVLVGRMLGVHGANCSYWMSASALKQVVNFDFRLSKSPRLERALDFSQPSYTLTKMLHLLGQEKAM